MFLLFIAIIYGRLSALIITKANEGVIGISPEQVVQFVMFLVAIITFIRMFFPSYKPIRMLVPKYYPVSKFTLYTASLISELISPFFLYLIIYFASCKNTSYDIRPFLNYGLNILFSSHLLRRIIQYQLDFKLKKIASVISIIVVIGIVIVVCSNLFFMNNIFPLLITIILFIMGFVLDTLTIEERNRDLVNNKIKFVSKNIYLKMILNRPSARLPIFAAIIFKLLFLGFDLFLFNIKGKHVFDGQLIYWLFCSPLLFFTYTFNNIWGFWKNLWFNLYIRTNNYKDMIVAGMKLQLFPLLIDAIMSCFILSFSQKDNFLPFFIVFYFTSLIFLFIFSFVWSLICPVYLKTTFQIKGSTSFISILVSITGVLFLALISLNIWFYIIVPIYLFIAFIAFRLSLKLYLEKKYSIANMLLKN
jgi:hypothetical protein